MISYLKTHKGSLLITLFCILFYVLFAYDLARSDFIKLISLVAALFYFSYKIILFSKGSFWHLVVVGILFRLILMIALPNLSQDFYRFLWDGRLVIQGISPYLFSPERFIGDGLPHQTIDITIAQANELYDGMGTLNGSHFSNYPPVNQILFAIAALFAGKSVLGSVIVLRVIIILADLGILYFGRKLLKLFGQEPNKIFWYFLNPFIIIELTGNLHFEGVMLFFLVWSFYLLYKQQWIWAAVLIGLSISAKLLPLILLPLFYQWFLPAGRQGVRKEMILRGILKLAAFYLITIGIFLLSFIPFYSPEISSNYINTIGLWFREFEFNASIYYLIRWIGYKAVGWNIIETVGKILPIIVILVIVMITFFRKNNNFKKLITAMLFGISFYFLFSTTVHPWYIATPLLLSVFTRYRFPLVWSFMVLFSYSAYTINGFSENLWLIGLEYTIVIVFFIWEVRRIKIKKKPLLNL